MKWIEALKEYNSKTGKKWFVPKKGTAEYNAVMKIMNGKLKGGVKTPPSPPMIPHLVNFYTYADKRGTLIKPKATKATARNRSRSREPPENPPSLVIDTSEPFPERYTLPKRTGRGNNAKYAIPPVVGTVLGATVSGIRKSLGEDVSPEWDAAIGTVIGLATSAVIPVVKAMFNKHNSEEPKGATAPSMNPLYVSRRQNRNTSSASTGIEIPNRRPPMSVSRTNTVPQAMIQVSNPLNRAISHIPLDIPKI